MSRARTIADFGDGIATADIDDGAVTAAKIGSLPAGSVLQVVQAVKNDVFSTASASYVDVTGLSVTITPSSTSSKILVIANLFVGSATTNSFTLGQVVRNSTVLPINSGSSGGFNAWANSNSLTGNNSQRGVNHNGITYLDEPTTTSATTYKIQVRTGSGTGYVNRWPLNEDLASVSSICVMEIAG